MHLVPFEKSNFTIEAELSVKENTIHACYTVSGDINKLKIPQKSRGKFADNLWKDTCFELFLQKGKRYLECNFSPSSDYAFYFFDSYRKRSKGEPAIGKPVISAKRDERQLKLESSFAVPFIPEKTGISVVLNTGKLEYFALSHNHSEPDFHDPRSFVRLKLLNEN